MTKRMTLMEHAVRDKTKKEIVMTVMTVVMTVMKPISLLVMMKRNTLMMNKTKIKKVTEKAMTK